MHGHCVLQGGRAVHKGGVYGFRTGEGPTAGDVPVYKIKIHDHYGQQEIEVEVPEDRCACRRQGLVACRGVRARLTAAVAAAWLRPSS